MKSVRADTPCNKKKGYPKLMISDQGGGANRILLMISDRKGTVVDAGDSVDGTQVGDYKDYVSLMYYSDYNGSVCLEND